MLCLRKNYALETWEVAHKVVICIPFNHYLL